MEVLKGFNGKAVKVLEPAERGVPGLHAVPLGVAHAHERGALVEPQGHQRLHLEVGSRQQVTVTYAPRRHGIELICSVL